MAESNFPVRFVIDEHFISDLLKDKELAIKVIRKLTHIHTKSSNYPFRHNIMFDESFKNAIKDKEIRGQAILGFVHPIPVPDFLKEEHDFYSKVIRYSISIADKIPRKIIILTSPDKQKNYESNQHYKDESVKETITIWISQSAISIIDIVYNAN